MFYLRLKHYTFNKYIPYTLSSSLPLFFPIFTEVLVTRIIFPYYIVQSHHNFIKTLPRCVGLGVYTWNRV